MIFLLKQHNIKYNYNTNLIENNLSIILIYNNI